MNTLLDVERASPVPHEPMLTGRTPGPTATDRLAMRVALWLLVRSTLPVGEDRQLRRAQHALDRQRTQRERAWEQRRHLLPLL